LGALDSEVVSLLLRTALRIHDLEEEPDPDIEGDRFVRTPEGRFVVEFEPDGADYVAVRRLVDDLYERDPFLAGRTISAVRWELPSDLEEGARRWRDGRLADLGFPDLEEALSWFARPAARAGAAMPGLPDRPPGFWLATFRRESLLDRAAARLSPDDAERFEAQLLSAANAALVADRVDPADPDAVRGGVESARALIEMGLEALSGGDAEAAARVLATTPLKTVFQQGFGRLLELRWAADRIRREAADAGPVPALDSPLGEALSAAARRRPRFFPGIDLPRDEWGQPAAGALEERAFRSTAEVERTARALDDAGALLTLGRSLGLAPPPGPNPPTLATLWLTALANERMGRPFAPAPFAAAELPAVARSLASVDDPRLDAAGPAGALLRDLARGRAAELAPIRAGESPPPGGIAAVLVSA
ncbi:MAG TPA: DUF6178 family protein, partial [Anaeromyxobacteraceae bacterium]|nr:DUF6178 family protein [Anaeromyxobacteraceae bacterium]